MRFHRAGTILLSLAIAACAAAPPGAAPVTPSPVATTAAATGVDAAAALITAASVQRHVEFLASDELLGRDTPSPGLEAAAEYLVAELRGLGLRPAGDDGSFIQRFPFEDRRLDTEAVLLEVRAAGTATRLAYADEYFVLPSLRDSVVGEPLFAGAVRPGMALGPAAAGRVVAFFVPDTVGQAWQMNVSAGLQAAFQAQAAGVIIVLDPAFPARTIAQLAHELQGQVPPFPVFGVRYDAARAMFRAAGTDLDAARARTDGALVPLAGVTVAMRTPIDSRAVMVPNVVAVLPGSDPALRDEYVVYSAHFDHVGVGAPDATGDSIYNGADDNASGTSAVLEAARAFAALDRAPARSIMFVFVSGEEKGLLGSMYFVEDPPVPVAQMVANINADMVGRNAPDSIVAIGQDYSTLGPTVQRVARANPGLGLVVAPDLWPEEQLFFRSDHFSFAAKEIPAIFFTSGLHEDYHRPSDQAHLIDSDKLSRVARLLFRVGHDVAENRARPEWTAEGLAEVRRATGGGM
jgi:Zn-dependent M28 family amino/carboxypeptidase